MFRSRFFGDESTNGRDDHALTSTGDVSTTPEFGPRQQLIAPAAESKFFEQHLSAGEEPKPGVRAQICVTDYNGDNRLDLIVGDYSDVNWVRELDAEEEKAFKSIVEKVDALVDRLMQLQNSGDTESAEYKKVVQDYTKTVEQRKKYYKQSRRASFVWLYLRSAPH